MREGDGSSSLWLERKELVLDEPRHQTRLAHRRVAQQHQLRVRRRCGRHSGVLSRVHGGAVGPVRVWKGEKASAAKFAESAPEEVVEETRANLAARESEEAQLKEALARLSEVG